MRYLAILLTLMTYNSMSWSGEIYKWKDENGNIHFSENPPSTPQTSVQQISKKTGGKSKTKPYQLNGKWYAHKLGETHWLTIKGREKFTWTIKTGPQNTHYYTGKYKNKDKSLTLSYVENNPHNSDSLTEYNDQLSIQQLTESTLTLRDNNGTQVKYFREYHPSRNPADDVLIGRWIDDSRNMSFNFSENNLRVYENKKNGRPTFIANWVLNNNKVNLQYVGNSDDISMLGLEESWSVIKLDEKQLIYVNQGIKYTLRQPLLGE